MSNQFMSARVAVLDQVRVVNTGKTVQWNTDFEIVPVADIEETLHAYLRAKVSESFRGPVPFVERVFGQRRLQGGSLGRLRPIPGFECDAKHKRNASIIRPFYRMFSHGDPFTIEFLTSQDGKRHRVAIDRKRNQIALVQHAAK